MSFTAKSIAEQQAERQANSNSSHQNRSYETKENRFNSLYDYTNALKAAANTVRYTLNPSASSTSKGVLDIVGDAVKIANGTYGNGSPKLTQSLVNSPGVNDVVDALLGDGSTASGSSGSGRGSGRGSGISYGSPGAPASGISSYDDVMKLINDTADANNAWSAKQAQLDREWQEYMSNTAHTREVQDLKNAGLNPVLSAGGNGASTPSGAMGQTDTSNTRLIGEVAMSALDAMSMTAMSFAGAGSKKNSKVDNSILGRITNAYSSNKLVKKLVDTGLNTAASVARIGIVKALL